MGSSVNQGRPSGTANGWKNPRVATPNELSAIGGFLYPLHQLIDRGRLPKGETRPYYVGPKLASELIGLNVRTTKTDPTEKYIFIPSTTFDPKVAQFLASGIIPQGFGHESGFVDFVATRLGLRGTSRIIERDDIPKKLKQDIIVKRILDAHKKDDTYLHDINKDLHGVESIYTVPHLYAQILRKLADPKYISLSMQSAFGRGITEEEQIAGCKQYLDDLGNKLQVKDLKIAVGKVCAATHLTPGLAEEIIGDRLVQWVKDVGYSQLETVSGHMISALDDIVKTLPKDVRRRVRKDIAEYGQTYFANQPDHALRDGQKFALGYAAHRAKGNLLFVGDNAGEKEQRFVDEMSGRTLAYVMADKNDLDRVINVFIEKYKRELAKIDAIRSSGDIQREDSAKQAERRLYEDIGFLFSDHDWSYGKLSSAHRQAVALGFLESYMQIYDTRFDATDSLSSKGVTRAIEKFGSAFGHYPQFNKDAIMFLQLEGNALDTIELAKRGVLPPKLAKSAVRNISDAVVGRNGRKSIERVGAMLANEKGDLVETLLAIHKVDMGRTAPTQGTNVRHQLEI